MNGWTYRRRTRKQITWKFRLDRKKHDEALRARHWGSFPVLERKEFFDRFFVLFLMVYNGLNDALTNNFSKVQYLCLTNIVSKNWRWVVWLQLVLVGHTFFSSHTFTIHVRENNCTQVQKGVKWARKGETVNDVKGGGFEGISVFLFMRNHRWRRKVDCFVLHLSWTGQLNRQQSVIL